MTVYIVTLNGRVQAVFSEREQAALYCAIREDVDYELRIDEWDTEAIRIASIKPLFYRWSVYINSNEKAIPKPSYYCTFKAENNVYEEEGNCWVVTFTVDKEITVEQAEELALDRLKEWKKNG